MKKPVAVNKIKLMLDSGAFSAWSRNGSIDLKAYIAYVKRNERYLYSYVTLDVLAAGVESKRTRASLEAGAEASYRNHCEMKAAGLKPIPVYHQGESFSHLERMLKDGEPYIGISTRKDIMVDGQRSFLDRVYTMLTDKEGRPIVKTHGFGITSPQLLLRYPFYTVDSTSWVLGPGFGKLLIPPKIGGEYRYDRLPAAVVVSGVPQSSKSSEARQYQGMGQAERKAVEEYLATLGMSVTQCRASRVLRCIQWVHYFKALTAHAKGLRFTSGYGLGIEGKEVVKRKVKGIEGMELTLMFVTHINSHWHAHSLNEGGADTQLLSYFDLRELPDEALAQYVTEGKAYVGPNAGSRERSWGNTIYEEHRRLALHDRNIAYAGMEDELP